VSQPNSAPFGASNLGGLKAQAYKWLPFSWRELAMIDHVKTSLHRRFAGIYRQQTAASAEVCNCSPQIPPGTHLALDGGAGKCAADLMGMITTASVP